MKVLVLGGCGFIGSHVVDSLVAKGLKVRVFDRGPERFRPPTPQVDYVYGDFRDLTSILDALTDVDVAMHLISATVPGTAALDPQADVRDNLVPTISMLEAMSKARVPKIVYLSSGGTVYGPSAEVPTSETEPLRPISAYGIVKVAIEQYIQLYVRERGIAATILRPSNPYGPRQGHTGLQGVVGTFLQRALNDEPIHVWGDGSVVRDYLYVGDLADLCCRCATSDTTGVFNAGSGQGLSINEVIERIRATSGKDLAVSYSAGRKLDVPISTLDISAATAAFGWRPSTDFATGVARYWDWLTSLPR